MTKRGSKAGNVACMTNQLISIPFSHYNQRAMWALQYYGISFTVEPYLPIFHFPKAFWVRRNIQTAGDGTASPYSTPVLIAEDGSVYPSSSEILWWADNNYGQRNSDIPSLYPEQWKTKILAVEKELHDSLGPHSRRVAYYVLLQQKPSILRKLARRNVGSVQASVFAMTRPIVTRMLQQSLRIHEKQSQKSIDKVRGIFSKFSSQVSDTGYLFGEKFTAADLTLACMASPVILPEVGYGASMPSLEQLQGAEVIEEFRSTPVGTYTLRMFAEREEKLLAPARLVTP